MLTLMFFKKAWEKIVNFVSKHWRYILVFIGGVATVLFFKRKSPVINDTKDIRDSHDKQLNKVNDIRNEERKGHDELTQKLNSDLAVVERQYEEQKKNLDEKKKEEIKTILQQHQDDPVALANELSKVTGFPVIMPKE